MIRIKHTENWHLQYQSILSLVGDRNNCRREVLIGKGVEEMGGLSYSWTWYTSHNSFNILSPSLHFFFLIWLFICLTFEIYIVWPIAWYPFSKTWTQFCRAWLGLILLFAVRWKPCKPLKRQGNANSLKY